MTDDQQMAFEAVKKINGELFDKYSQSNLMWWPTLSITFADHYIFVSISILSENTLPEILLYSSVEDERIYYDKTDKYETYYHCIKRKFREIKAEINSIKLG